jgi:HEAT repeat protein
VKTLLSSCLRDRNQEVRTSGAEAVGKGRFTELARSLDGLLSDEYLSVRAAALEALVRLGPEEGFAPVEQLMGDPQASLPQRVAAIKALARWSLGPEALARGWNALRRAFQDEESTLGFTAYVTIGRMAAHHPVPEEVKQALRQRLDDHRARYATYLRVRDANREATDEATRDKRRKELEALAPPVGLTYEIAFALCRTSRDLVEHSFLEDDLQEVRDAAVTYVVLQGDIPLLERIDRLRAAAADNFLTASDYAAIDLRLQAFETIGTESDAKLLHAWRDRSQPGVVRDRVDWTIEAIEDRLKNGTTP